MSRNVFFLIFDLLCGIANFYMYHEDNKAINLIGGSTMMICAGLMLASIVR